ncbi:MAG: glycoside hydrolase family 130 protein [Phycisphaerae bacterium]
MPEQTGRDVVHRWEGNPVISLDDLEFQCSDILNAAAVKFQGETILLVTVEGLQGRCRLYLARSSDGLHFTVEDKPFMSPSRESKYQVYETLGIRDARITCMDGVYYITYVAIGYHGMRLALAKTTDFVTCERMGLISQVDVKNGVLFPRKIHGRYALLERPDDGKSIWLIHSDDLDFWGDGRVVMTPRGGHWDTHVIGAAAPPIELDDGWLVLYYGQRHTSAGPLVRLGAAVLDRDDPSKVLGRSDIPILSPREKYERIGDIPNVVFCCGAFLQEDDVVEIYYGASDSCIALGTAPLEDILENCYEKEEFHE